MIKKINIFMTVFIVLLCIGFVVFVFISRENRQKALNTSYISATVPEYTVDDLIERSCLIVKATYTGEYEDIRVKSSKSDVEENFRNVFFNYTDVYYGNIEGDELTVRMRGGDVGGYNVINSSNPLFEKGEEYILFLYEPSAEFKYETDDEHYFIPGTNAGVFPIDNDRGGADSLYSEYSEADVSDEPSADPITESIGSFTKDDVSASLQVMEDYIKSETAETVLPKDIDRNYAEIVESTGRKSR